MKSCSGKPCNEQGDCEHCKMADGPDLCSECGDKMIPWGYIVVGHPEKDYDGIICQTCGHKEKLKDGEKDSH